MYLITGVLYANLSINIIREGRQQEAARVTELLTSLRHSSQHILRNPSAVLTFLHSMGDRRGDVAFNTNNRGNQYDCVSEERSYLGI